MSKPLAIVIPAYKDTFFESTLASIAAQTSKDFTLYVGDDASPYDIKSIVDKFSDKIDIVYHRFCNNLGGKDLVGHWERCIDLTTNEPYLWLFSDDDIMDSRCVETFLNLDESTRDNYLVHFNVKVIDEKSLTLFETPSYPTVLSSLDYLRNKYSGNFYSYVVEFVFSRKLFMSNGRFNNYDLAWGTDFITWLKLSDASNGIYTIQDRDSYISWRKSSQNISPDTSHDVILRKIRSLIENAVDVQHFLLDKTGKKSFKISAKFVWGEINRNCKVLSYNEIMLLFFEFVKKLGFLLFSIVSLIVVIINKTIHVF